MAYVTGAGILTHVRAPAPTPADEAWADMIAAAIEAEIADALEGVTVAEPSDDFDRLAVAALTDGAAAYTARDAPHGILTTGPDQQATRLGPDIIRALRPVLRRVGTPGIG